MALRSAGVCAATTIAALGLGAQSAAAETGLSDKVARQIAELQQLKRSYSPAERKLDSRLVVTVRRRAGSQRIPRAAAGARTRDGMTVVDVRARTTGPAILKRLAAVGGRVRSAKRGTIRVRLPLRALEQVA